MFLVPEHCKANGLDNNSGTTVVFCYHEGAMGHLGIPVRDQDCIEWLRLAYLRTPDHYHEIGHHGIVQSQFRLSAGSEIIYRADLD